MEDPLFNESIAPSTYRNTLQLRSIYLKLKHAADFNTIIILHFFILQILLGIYIYIKSLMNPI